MRMFPPAVLLLTTWSVLSGAPTAHAAPETTPPPVEQVATHSAPLPELSTVPSNGVRWVLGERHKFEVPVTPQMVRNTISSNALYHSGLRHVPNMVHVAVSEEAIDQGVDGIYVTHWSLSTEIEIDEDASKTYQRPRTLTVWGRLMHLQAHNGPEATEEPQQAAPAMACGLPLCGCPDAAPPQQASTPATKPKGPGSVLGRLRGGEE